MICEWDACHEKADDNQTLGAHIYHAHIEPQPKELGAFTCKWRGCNSRPVFKYRSHLALHLNDHLNGNLSNETELGSGWSYMDANTIVCNFSERLACPDKSCELVSPSKLKFNRIFTQGVAPIINPMAYAKNTPCPRSLVSRPLQQLR